MLRGLPRTAARSDVVIPIDLSGRNGLVFGVANKRSLAWGIAERLAAAGMRLGFT